MRLIRFGANGWQARFDDGFDDEGVARVADALGLLWGDAHTGATVLVGRDERYGAAAHARLMGQVMASFGLRVKVSDGPCPTPALGWCAAHDGACVGAVMLTASESSCEYGGVLLRGADGGPVSGTFLHDLNHAISTVPTADRGPVEAADFVTPYIEGVLGQLDVGALRAAGLKVVADPMYGAAMTTMAPLLGGVGCEVSLIHAEPAPDFVGLHPAPIEPWVDKCERQVVETGASCGLVLDGDADRAGLIDERGRLVSRHDLVPLLMGHLVRGRGATGRMVATTATTMRVERQAGLLDVPLTTVPVGFERIYEEVREGDVFLASEEYGGVCVPTHLPERDGIFACLLVLELMAQTGRSLSELVDEQTAVLGPMVYRQKDLRLDGASLQRLRNLLPGMNPGSVGGRVPVRVSHTDGMMALFDDGAWVQLRVSRIQALARAYAEAPTDEECSRLLAAACDFARDSH